MNKKHYIELRNTYKTDHLSFLYNYFLSEGGELKPQQFAVLFTNWTNKFEDILRHLDIKHKVTIMQNLETGEYLKWY